MDTRKGLAEQVGKFGAYSIEFGRLDDACPKSLAVEPLHDKARAHAIFRLQHVIDLWLGYAVGACHLHELRFCS